MRVSKILYVAVVISLSVISCQKELNTDEYKSYISNPENGLRKDEAVGDFDISVMYEPAEYLAGRENSKKSTEELLLEYQQFEQFQVRIKLREGGNILMYKETPFKNEVTRINHFSFFVQQDFYVVSGEDTSRCKLAHFSRNYNLSPTVDLSLIFDSINKESDWQFVYTDQQFDLGRIKFVFKSEDLTSLPALKN